MAIPRKTFLKAMIDPQDSFEHQDYTLNITGGKERNVNKKKDDFGIHSSGNSYTKKIKKSKTPKNTANDHFDVFYSDYSKKNSNDYFDLVYSEYQLEKKKSPKNNSSENLKSNHTIREKKPKENSANDYFEALPSDYSKNNSNGYFDLLYSDYQRQKKRSKNQTKEFGKDYLGGGIIIN